MYYDEAWGSDKTGGDQMYTGRRHADTQETNHTEFMRNLLINCKIKYLQKMPNPSSDFYFDLIKKTVAVIKKTKHFFTSLVVQYSKIQRKFFTGISHSVECQYLRNLMFLHNSESKIFTKF